ncbi:hypothetical protein [Sulfobacillus harzensis]|uniref:Uncharacterized protein n=1 Tax=Sulfobacillus harzensis TaxID=2729629 RepID=A0A7Y0Q592_9FIRM|nr:hypothetical protein [Sulfobacillus harzensis]NMP25205.1 hypothetical protein [Sulfobacillus harzensis]
MGGQVARDYELRVGGDRESAPFGPGFPDDLLHQADTMEIWSRDLEGVDEGDAAVEYRLLQSGIVMAVHRVLAS